MLLLHLRSGVKVLVLSLYSVVERDQEPDLGQDLVVLSLLMIKTSLRVVTVGLLLELGWVCLYRD